MKNIKRFLTLILALFLFVPSTYAVSISDLANADDTLKLEKNLYGTSFSAGNTVNISSKIEGISFVAGNIVNDSSESDYLFEAGNFIDIKEMSTKDAFIAGNQINIVTNDIKRDAYVVGSTITIDGKIGRNLYASAEKIVLKGKIKGNVTLEAKEIEILNTAVIEGTLKYDDEAKVKISKTAIINERKTYSTNAKKDLNAFVDYSMEFLSSYGNVLIFGLILMLLMRKVFDKIDAEKMDSSSVIKTIGFGFISLIAIPFVAIIFMMTGVGVATSFIALILFGITVYASSIVTAYYFGKKLLNSKIDNDYLLFTLSLLALKLIMVIPIIGGLVSLFSLLFGLGMIFILIKKSLNNKKKK